MAFVKSFGRALPSRVVTNSELATRIGCEESWILQMSGIVERRWAASDESVVDLAVRAGEDAVARARGGSLANQAGLGFERQRRPALPGTRG